MRRKAAGGFRASWGLEKSNAFATWTQPAWRRLSSVMFLGAVVFLAPIALSMAVAIPKTAVAQPSEEEAAGDSQPAESGADDSAGPSEGAPSGASEGEPAEAGASAGGEAAGSAAAGAGAEGGATGESPEGASGETTTSAERDPEMDAGTYAVRLRDLEQRINELKEQIFRSKARLSLLAETVLQGVVAGAQSVIVHENRMSSSYRLVKATYALDGAPIFNRADEEGTLGEREEFQVYNGSIVPGEHTLTVNLEYRGHGYGIFSYLKGYRFKVRSNYSFTAPEGRAVTVRVVGYEKGGPTAPLEERPAIRYVERVSDRSRRPPSESSDESQGDEGDQ